MGITPGVKGIPGEGNSPSEGREARKQRVPGPVGACCKKAERELERKRVSAGSGKQVLECQNEESRALTGLNQGRDTHICGS